MPIPTASTSAQPAPPRPTTTQAARDGFEPAAGILACLFPGLGHWYLGERGRAGVIAAGVMSLFFGGVLIGGIDVVDSREDTIWFAGQALVGPVAFGVDYAHQNHFKVAENGRVRSANPGETRDPQGRPIPAAAGQRPPNSKSLGRMNEMGTLFCTIAGMLNLIVIIDALMHTKRIPARELGLRTGLPDANAPLAAPQSIDPSLRGGA